ncbi:DUF4179 domain-containing protein [Solibacillus sp. FSL K6-1523]|uniref:DUF4179 domain-containing protein n=1 Tax=Solibacillus sp. FSL K6-1523 TaxID=2921471 RepID=UPI0030FB01C4
MKNNEEEHLQQEMNKEQELPSSIRITFDQSYEKIRQQSKKKRKKSWLKPVSAAVATIALSSAILLTNDTVLAKLQAFFGFNDSGLNTASENGDVQYVGQATQSEGIKITMEHFFADAFKLGLQLNIETEEIQMDDLYFIDMEYLLYNAQGEVIDSHLSDTKPIAGPLLFSGNTFQLENLKKNTATLEMLADSSAKAVPPLDGAKIAIETMHFYTNKEGVISVDGEWIFDLQPGTVETQDFVAENEVAGLELLQATLTNGSMHISYKINRNVKDENYYFNTALINNSNEEFFPNGARIEYADGYTTINSVFPYSIWNEHDPLSLSVKGYEKLRLIKEE